MVKFKKKLKRMNEEQLVKLFDKFDKESTLVLKDPSPDWQNELQWYADELMVIANELETRGIEVKNKWWESYENSARIY